jgi:hypothetical protein
MRKVRRRLKMPAPAALDELDPSAFVLLRKLTKGYENFALSDVLCDFLNSQRGR